MEPQFTSASGKRQGFKWRPIQDLPDSWKELSSSELASLSPIWNEQVDKLRATDVLEAFNDRLQREWSIETGIIENLYTIDRGTTQLLIERGIEVSLIPHGSTDRPAEEIVAILRDHEDTLEGLFDFVSQRRQLTVSYIRQLHQALTRNQFVMTAVNGSGRSIEVELNSGEWKQLPNNPTRPDGSIHEYCPPEHVQSEMERLIDFHNQHVGLSMPPEIEAAWLHHRFTQIHPFQDGNGRVARALATLIFLQSSWFPLSIHRDQRSDYIDTLEAADAGEIRPLVELFSRVQKQYFLRALRISDDVLRDVQPLQQVIAAATERLKARFEKQVQDQQKVFELSRILEAEARQKFDGIAENLRGELKKLSENYWANAEGSTPDTEYWFKKQIVELAKRHEYFADTRTYASWVRLRVVEERRAELVVSFHSLGTEFLGIVAASAFLEFRDKTEEGETTVDGPYELSREIYQCSYNEDGDAARSRFDAWLNDIVLSGLDLWRRQL